MAFRPPSTLTVQQSIDVINSGGGVRIPAPAAGRYFGGRYLPASSVQLAPGAGAMFAAPWYVPKDGFAVDRIGINLDIAGVGGTVIRLGFYEDNGYGEPGALLVEAGTVPGVAPLGIKELAWSYTFLDGGLVWAVAVPQGGNPTIGGERSSAIGHLTLLHYENAVNFFTDQHGGWTYTGAVNAALPDPFTVNPARSSWGPAVWVRAA